MAGFTYKIESGVPIDASEVRQNFEDLKNVTNDLKDRNFEHGAINTRHLNPKQPPSMSSGLSEEVFMRNYGAPLKRIGLRRVGLNTSATDFKVTASMSEIGAGDFRVSLDTRGLKGPRGFTLIALAHLVICDADSSGDDGLLVPPAASQDVHIEFKLQYESLPGVFVDFSGGGSDHSIKKVTIGSELRRSDIAFASTFGIASCPSGVQPDKLHVRLMAQKAAEPGGGGVLSHSYFIGGTLKVFSGVR